MKGLNVSISLVVILMVSITVVVIISMILSNNVSGLESFAINNIKGSLGGVLG
ncbi:MAG: hypothetical protein R6V35_03155 [Candidatus Nanohaloarchaea archaeon]